MAIFEMALATKFAFQLLMLNSGLKSKCIKCEKFQYQNGMKHEDKIQRQFGYIERLSIATPIVIQLKMKLIAVKAD